MQSTKPANVSDSEWAALQRELSQFKDSSIHPSQLADIKSENLGNNVDLEEKWAEKAFKHAEVYFNMISSIKDQAAIPLTKINDKIYDHFKKSFPTLNVGKFTENCLKSESEKVKWREFCNTYNDNIVKDFNFATLLRLDSSIDYSQENCCIVPRIQFLAIEIARNKEGYNKQVLKN